MSPESPSSNLPAPTWAKPSDSGCEAVVTQAREQASGTRQGHSLQPLDVALGVQEPLAEQL